MEKDFMRAVIVESLPERRLVLRDVPESSRGEGEVLVRVRAISLNRGEVNEALTGASPGPRPGVDFSGVVEEAPEGSGFQAGDRVAGLRPAGAWAERIAVPPFLLARVPDGVGFEQAAALPVAGLTAMLALAKGAPLANRRVLVTGATGGVGLLAVQLAARAGAHVTALARAEAHRSILERAGAHAVAIGSARAEAGAPYHLILESVGGALLGEALGWLASRGGCVLVGNSGGATTTFDADRFRMGGGGVYGGTTLYGFYLGEELERAPPGQPLMDLLQKVAEKSLDPMISVTASWSRIHDVATALLERRFLGKAVLLLD